PCRRGDGIAAERAAGDDLPAHAFPTRSQLAHDVLTTDDRGDREASTDGLAVGCQVGRYPVQLLATPPGNTEAGHDLVIDQHHAALLGGLAERLEKTRAGRNATEQRFDNDRRQAL